MLIRVFEVFILMKIYLLLQRPYKPFCISILPGSPLSGHGYLPAPYSLNISIHQKCNVCKSLLESESPLVVNMIPSPSKFCCYSSVSVAWKLASYGLYLTYNLSLISSLSLVVEAASGDFQRPAKKTYRILAPEFSYKPPPLGPLNMLEAFFKISSSSVSLPTSCSSWAILSRWGSFLPSEKSFGACSMSFFPHRLSWSEAMLYLRHSSAWLVSPLRDSNATFALNSGLYRFLLAMLHPPFLDNIILFYCLSKCPVFGVHFIYSGKLAYLSSLWKF